MKKLLVVLVMHISFCVGENFFNSINTQDNIFVLFVTDKNNEIKYAKFELDILKKSNFPEGPHRLNEINESDFSNKISNEKREKVLNDEASFQLPLFCIEVPNIESKRACGFELPLKSKLSYVFYFNNDLNDIKGVIINKDRLFEIEIDDETTILKPKDKEPEKPQHWLKEYWIIKKICAAANWATIKSQQIALALFMKYLDTKNIKN